MLDEARQDARPAWFGAPPRRWACARTATRASSTRSSRDRRGADLPAGQRAPAGIRDDGQLFGTLGILTKLTFRLVPATPFVRLTYETHRTLAAYQQAISENYHSKYELWKIYNQPNYDAVKRLTDRERQFP
jgi:FAD/FMN-containing dehydrogenase